MRIILITLTLIASSISYGQIEISVVKITPDSVLVQFPKNMKIKAGTEYEFIYKTNVKLSDSLKESLSFKYLYDGLKVKKSFEHYERGIYIKSKVKNELKNTFDVGHNMFYVEGTEKFKIKIDGQYISNSIPNVVRPNSIVEIEIQSDNYDLSKAEYQEPVVLQWLADPSRSEKYEFDGNKLRIDISKFGPFMSILTKAKKHNAIVILLPQVKVKGKKLFSDEKMKRMYIIKYVKYTTIANNGK
jgi:hypothetical protein